MKLFEMKFDLNFLFFNKNVLFNYFVQCIMICIFNGYKSLRYLYSMINGIVKVILKVFLENETFIYMIMSTLWEVFYENCTCSGYLSSHGSICENSSHFTILVDKQFLPGYHRYLYDKDWAVRMKQRNPNTAAEP